MEAYAVVESGGKQYRVRAGDSFPVERLAAEAGAAVTLAPVLAVSDGQALTIGRPVVEGAAVAATVVKHLRGPKVVAFRKKRRKGYHRKQGHRQELTLIRIDSVK